MSSAGPKRPPGLAERLLLSCVPASERAEIRDDLRELFEHRVRTRGGAAARRWYVAQVPSFALGYRARRRAARRAARGGALSSIGLDVRYAVRLLRRTPGFACATACTLALGIGANAALWSVVHPVLLRPLGFDGEDRIVRVWPEHRFTREGFERLRHGVRSFETFAAFSSASFSWTGERAPEVVPALAVSADHFRTFRVRPVLGRDFRPADHRPGSERVAIVSHETWQAKLAGARSVLGQSVELGGLGGGRFTLIGVAPPGFRPFGERCDFWVALEIDPSADTYTHVANLGVVGRLEDGVGLGAAEAELETLARTLRPPPSYLDRLPEYRILPLRDVLVEGVEPTLYTLLAAVGVVLLLCCCNVANLVLARSAAREREVAIRGALGAGAGRIARQLVTENVVLSLLGGALGVGLAAALSPLLGRLTPPDVPRGDTVGMDGGVLLFTLGISLGSALLFGLVPSVRLAARAAGVAGRASAAPRSRARLQRALVASEIALSLVLVLGSALLVKSFWKLQQVETGFRQERVVSMKLLPSTVRYATDEELFRYYAAVLAELRSLADVEAAAAIQLLPMTPRFMAAGYSPSGEPVPPGVEPPSVSYRIVTPDYRRALGIPLVRGRDLTDADRPGAEAVGLVNETLARELWPGADPIGKTVHYEDGSLWFRVVGVVGDVRQHRLDRPPRAEVYVPHAQDSWPPSMSIVVKVRRSPAEALSSLRERVWSVDPDVPIREVETMGAVVHGSMREPRQRTSLFSAFAVVAFALSLIGVYGVVAYVVSQRTREIGIELALGATGFRVMVQCLRSGLGPAVAGILSGVALSLLAARLLRGFLFDVEPTDPAVFVSVIAAIAASALLAALVPARRAARVDPLLSLRADA